MTRRLLLAVLVLDTVLLALLEVFFLPLRLDGQLLPQIGDIPFPVSVVLAAVSMPILIVQTAKLISARAALLPLALWILTVVVVIAVSPGGDRIVPMDWRAMLLLVSGTFPGVLALGGVISGIAKRGLPHSGR